MEGKFPNLSYEEQHALIDLCLMPKSTKQTERNYLELMHYLYENGVVVSVIHADVRCFSRTTKGVAMRLRIEQVRQRRIEREGQFFTEAASLLANGVV